MYLATTVQCVCVLCYIYPAAREPTGWWWLLDFPPLFFHDQFPAPLRQSSAKPGGVVES